MALNPNTIIIPGRGTVLLAPVDTPAPNFDSLDFHDPDTFDGWTISHTSRENTVAFEKDGGDAEQKGSWEVEALRIAKAPTQLSWTAAKLQMDQETLELAFGSTGNTWNEETQSLDVKQFGTTPRAVCIVMVDANNNRGGWYLPNNEVSIGDMPEVDVENFYELQLNGQVLASPTTGVVISAFATRPHQASEPAA